MTEYMQVLLNVCFTMVTGVVIFGCFGAIAMCAIAIWNMIQDHIN